VYLITDPDLRYAWTLGLIVAVVVVIAVVVLLVAILLAARRILAAAARCLKAVETIRVSTTPLHELTTTNAVAGDLLSGAGSIKKHAEAIAGALEATEQPSTRSDSMEAQRHE
jgi:hypothetical protein